jgi:hypothetical protein
MLDDQYGWKLGQAWDMAWQIRFCPPQELILADRPAPEALAHLRACPCCHELAACHEELGPWPGPAVSSAPAAMAANAERQPPELAVGQLWSLAPGLGGWGPKRRFYNPPLVLILREGLHLANGVLVAQTYHDPLLQGEDDVPMDPHRFAQPWNIYTLHRDNLGAPQGQFGPEAAERVLKASQNQPPRLDQGSALHVFRQMEIELGSYFASAAICALMEEYQTLAEEADTAQAPLDVPEQTQAAGALPESWPDPSALGADLAGLGLELPAGKEGVAAADLYFLATPPLASLPLAAAGLDSSWEVTAMALALCEGRPTSCCMLDALVTDYVGSPQVAVGGRLSTPLPAGEPWRAQFRWLDEAGRLVESRAGVLTEGEDGLPRFWALFPLAEEGDPALGLRLRIRLFRQERQRK